MHIYFLLVHGNNSCTNYSPVALYVVVVETVNMNMNILFMVEHIKSNCNTCC